MTLEEALRQIVREELAGVEQRLADRLRPKGAPIEGDRLLRPSDAQKLTGYSAHTILGWVRKGKLSRHGTIRAVRVSEAELRAFLASFQSPTKPGQAGGDDLPNAAILELARRRARR